MSELFVVVAVCWTKSVPVKPLNALVNLTFERLETFRSHRRGRRRRP